MKNTCTLLLSTLLLALPLSSVADPWKDESGHDDRRGYDRREYKEEFWEGNCKVERKLEKNGEYKEERKCKAPSHGEYRPPSVYTPPPAATYGLPRPHVPSPRYEERSPNFTGQVPDPYLERR